jgi:elongation factor Ts
MGIIEDIKKLREETGVGMLDCKAALEASGGDVEKAKVHLRKQGIQKAGNRGHKVASEGIVGTYNHTGGRICVMVEVNCETDFVARGDDFQNFAHDLAMHIAAVNPKWIRREDVPQSIIDTEKEIMLSGLENKPENIRGKIVDGKINKFFKDNCLLEQQFVKDQNMTIQDLYDDLVMKIKEKIVVKRFSRFEVGE